MKEKPLSGKARALLSVLGVASILLLWQFGLPAAGVPAYIAPTPDKIAAAFVRDWEILLDNFLPTCVEAAAGFFVGNGAAVALAALFVWSRTVYAAYFPVALFFNTIPILALSPVVILIFGLGMTPKIVIAAVICFFPTLVNMIRGLNSPGRGELELFEILSADKGEVFLRLRWPRALPLLFSSLRIASATAVIGAIVGEWIGSDKGLGALIIKATFNYQSDRLYAAIVMSSSLSILFFAAVAAVEWRVMRHRADEA